MEGSELFCHEVEEGEEEEEGEGEEEKERKEEEDGGGSTIPTPAPAVPPQMLLQKDNKNETSLKIRTK